jgi:hypothetical protein
MRPDTSGDGSRDAHRACVDTGPHFAGWTETVGDRTGHATVAQCWSLVPAHTGNCDHAVCDWSKAAATATS